MSRYAAAAGAVVSLLLVAGSPAGAVSDSRALPMQFEVWTEGPPQACGNNCRIWVSAAGAITADTPRDFEAFAKNRKLQGMTIALDSDGGSVLGALALGRSIRKLGMTTTVGRTVDLSSADGGRRRARLLPRAYCESMCAFVLLAGVSRHVPAEARVMVHQIWLGDRRDDPTAANYSAEDLVVVQRDIGQLAQYTVEMGGGIDMLEIALKIPPWEPMRLLTRDELRSMKVVTAGDSAGVGSAMVTNSTALANGTRAPVNGQGWAVLAANNGGPALSRNHPLTVEGEEIGAFQLNFGCGEAGRDFTVTYIERRHGDDGRPPSSVTEIELTMAGKAMPLKVVSSAVQAKSSQIDSVAVGRVPAELLKTFAESNSRSLMVETVSEDISTLIRIGNAGASRALGNLVASCGGAQTPIRNTARLVRQGG